jgi:steroid 5-alpha reductase family enzyme
MSALVLFAAAMALALLMAAAWGVQRWTGNSGWIDAIWSVAVGLVGAAAALAPIRGQDGPTQRQMLVAIIVLAWSLRLGVHIARRTSRGGDDPRYRALREEWGERFSVQLFRFLQIQAAAGFVLVVSIFCAARHIAPLGWGDLAGVAIIAIAVAGEALADRQLERFRATPGAKGGVCEGGLWGASRHPNYFFEWLAWLAYPVIAVGVPVDIPLGLIALAGPAFMYWLLVHVSGIPPLEKHMLNSRGPAFASYQRRVNAFFPGPRHG